MLLLLFACELASAIGTDSVMTFLKVSMYVIFPDGKGGKPIRASSSFPALIAIARR